MPSTTPLTDIVHEYHQVLADQAFDRVPDYLTDDFTVDIADPATGEHETGGAEAAVAAYEGVFGAFSETRIEEHEHAEASDWVLCRATFTGTHTGPIFGIEPSGASISMQLHHSFRFEDGRIAEMHSTANYAALLGQLGVDLPMGG